MFESKHVLLHVRRQDLVLWRWGWGMEQKLSGLVGSKLLYLLSSLTGLSYIDSMFSCVNSSFSSSLCQALSYVLKVHPEARRHNSKVLKFAELMDEHCLWFCCEANVIPTSTPHMVLLCFPPPPRPGGGEKLRICLIRLERWLRGSKHWLLFQRFWSQFPAFTWWLTTINCYSFMGSDDLF